MIQDARGTGSHGRKKALVVEDEDSVRAFIRRVLEKEGYECREAGSAEEAVVAVGTESALNLLVLDIMLPDSWGTRVVDDIRAQSPGVGVILISGYAESDPILGAGTRDRGPFLEKPFEEADLVRAVRQVEAAAPS